ncbi:MAG: membrane protein insertase YidC [Desulfonatronovibrionaceae bacterium]
MDNKRVFLAVSLCIVVLVLWNILFPPVPPVQQQAEQTARTEEKAGSGREKEAQAPQDTAGEKADTAADRAEAEVDEDFVPESGREVEVDTPLYKAVFNSQGGIVEQFELKKYEQTIKPDSEQVDLITHRALAKGPMGVIWDRRPTWSEGEWALEGGDLRLEKGEKKSLEFTGRMDDLRFVRELVFEGGSYVVEETLTVIDTGGSPNAGELAFVLSTPTLSSEDNRYNRTQIMYRNQEGISKEDDADDLREIGIKTGMGVDWGGISSNYFLLGMIPDTKDMYFKARLEDDIYRLALVRDFDIPADSARRVTCTYYLGPKVGSQLAKAPNDLKSSLQYGWAFFDLIAKPLMQVLNFFYEYTGNYGIAIIILTIIIKIIFWPLSQKSYKSMNKMKKIQPMMTKIKEKYKDDRQKMNEEMMRLYKTYKVNPAGGCLPMLVQIPVFIALYQALLSAIELRHAPFIYHLPFTDIVWLADLSAKDPLYITPLIMGATMFMQQKMTPSPGDPTQAKIMLFMPVVFTFIFLTFPSGLVVYWLANNVLSIAQQWWMLKKEA